MAVAMKLFLVIAAFVCCLQLVEMARLRRDEAAAAPADNISAMITNLVDGLKTQIEEQSKKFTAEDAANLAKKLTEESQDFLKKALESINKVAADVKSD